jgi:hypothetical protein
MAAQGKGKRCHPQPRRAAPPTPVARWCVRVAFGAGTSGLLLGQLPPGLPDHPLPGSSPGHGGKEPPKRAGHWATEARAGSSGGFFGEAWVVKECGTRTAPQAAPVFTPRTARYNEAITKPGGVALLSPCASIGATRHTRPFSVARGDRQVHCDSSGHCGRQDARADSLRAGLHATAVHVWRSGSGDTLCKYSAFAALAFSCGNSCPSQRSTPRITQWADLRAANDQRDR